LRLAFAPPHLARRVFLPALGAFAQHRRPTRVLDAAVDDPRRRGHYCAVGDAFLAVRAGHRAHYAQSLTLCKTFRFGEK